MNQSAGRVSRASNRQFNMKSLRLFVCLSAALCALELSAQVLDERLKPKTPPPAAKKASVPEQAAPQSSPEDEVQVTERLIGLVVVRSKEEIKREGGETLSGLQVREIPILAEKDFAALIEPHFGKPAQIKTLKAIQREIILYCRTHDRPLVDVIVPNQEVNATNGVVQMVFIEGRVGKISVKNEGKQWFKEESISKGIRLQPGDVISEKRLLADIDWLNRNPFREVNPAFRQGEQAGLSDLQIEVQDRLPVRGFAGYENTGTKATGLDRLFAGVNFGNLWEKGHQLNYQFTTDTEFDKLFAHSASYVIPLPCRHNLSIYGTYVDINGDLANGFTSEGVNYQAAIRYAVPLRPTRHYQHEASVGFDYKHNENNLLFGGAPASADSPVDVTQLAFGYTGSLSDKWGRTGFGAQGFWSPGGFVGDSSNTDFDAQNEGAKNDYLYGRLTVERVTRLPRDFSFIVRANGQLANGSLIPSEQIGIGGYSTVRGYEEREANGDKGFSVTAELRTPSLKVLGRSPKTKLDDQLQFLVFYDYGQVEDVNPSAAEQDQRRDLESVGAGLRYTMSRYLSLRLDYAYRIVGSGVKDATGEDTGSRVHIGLTLSY